jgi:hypothetical protein
MDIITQPPVLDAEKLQVFGDRLFSLYGTHKTDRKAAEEQWLRNLRQFRGIYDPEIIIPSDRSRAYPKLTRWIVIGTVARLMQMLFPSTEKNYGIKASPLPDISVEALQKVLDDLVAQASQAQQIPPEQVVLDDDAIIKAVFATASDKAARMETKLDDDLLQMEYITLIRRMVFSAVVYNVGVLAGPYHTKDTVVKWQKNQFTSKYEATMVDKYKPMFEFVPVWEWFPDMTAKTLDKQDGTFRRHVMTREEVEALALRPDFLAPQILEWLRKNESGNFQSLWFETQLKGEPKSDRKYAQREGRKYEVISYWGNVTGHELRASGATVSDADLGRSFHANSWMIDNVVIKAKLAPLGPIPQYHTFMFEEDDLSLLGNGQCDVIRDSQMGACEVTRAALDNASVIGPMAIMNDDIMAPGQDLSIRKHATFHVESLSGNQNLSSAVANLSIDSHIPDLLALRAVFIESAGKESGLPPPSLGDVSGGGSEALRTQRNASMFLGAAALPVRDTVRNFDTFTISAMNALVAWNMKYDPDPARDGDHNVIARGSTSLIAKEVLSLALDTFRQTVTPDEQPHIKSRKLLEERMKAHDLPVSEILEDEDKANAMIKAQQDAQQAQVALQEGLVRAQVEEILTNAMQNVAKAKKADASITADNFELIVQAIHGGLRLENDAAKIEADKNKLKGPAK